MAAVSDSIFTSRVRVRPSSSIADGLVDPLFSSAAVDAAVSDTAWLQAMLDFEAALAEAEADAGLVPAGAASEIAAACLAEFFDAAEIGRRTVESGNPAAPLVRALTDRVSTDAKEYVHLGATSQDVIDTAFSLMARRALDAILADMAVAGSACATLAANHAHTLMTARTLLQPATPTTFGLKAAGWLVSIDEASALLEHVRADRLAVQLGGAAGTLASLQGSGVDVARRVAARLGLAEPVLPWHTNRTRVAELAAALGTALGVLGKIARDVVLLAQAEVAEAAESEHGTSSTLPQKRNPVRAVLVLAAAERGPGLVATVFSTMIQEHERAAGAWHAEWETVRELLRITGAASHHAAALLGSLQVDPDRMAENLAADGGLVMAEHLALQLARHTGRSAASEIVRRCGEESNTRKVAFADVVQSDTDVRLHLSDEQITAALDPVGYLGSVDELIGRAQDAHRATGADT
jgi:3-carboxy-cis,cis-muconate cycloisomerase